MITRYRTALLVLLLVHSSRAYCTTPSLCGSSGRNNRHNHAAAADDSHALNGVQAAIADDGGIRSNTGAVSSKRKAITKLRLTDRYNKMSQRLRERSLENNVQFLKYSSLGQENLYKQMLSDLKAELKADMRDLSVNMKADMQEHKEDIIKALATPHGAAQTTQSSSPSRTTEPASVSEVKQKEPASLLFSSIFLNIAYWGSLGWLWYSTAKMWWHF